MLGRKFLHRHIEGKLHLPAKIAQPVHRPLPGLPIPVHFAPRTDGSLGQRKIFVGNDKLRIEFERHAETRALLTCSFGTIE